MEKAGALVTTAEAGCPFCEVPPERIIAVSESVVALYDGFPVSPGHALVVPRRHVASWDEVSPEERAAIWQAVDEVRSLIADHYRPPAFNVGFNDGAAAGQTVMHFHVHIIPRYAGDAVDPRGGIRWVLPEKAAFWDRRTMTDPVTELEFLLKIQRILDEGDFVATYKFALLNALADISVESDVSTGQGLVIPLSAIAEKFVGYYWMQSRPYRAIDGRAAVLKQNTGRQAAVINAIVKLQEKAPTLGAARHTQDWRRLCRRVSGIIDQMPLWKLQNVGGEVDEFLYREAEFSAGCIRLLPGVPQAFRSLYGLVVDAVRGAWIRQITRIAANRQLLGDADLSLFLFGSSRRSLVDFAHILREHQASRCLYCQKQSGTTAWWTTSYRGLDIRWTLGITWFWHMEAATLPSGTSWLIPHIWTGGSDPTSKGPRSSPGVSMPASWRMISTVPGPSPGGPMSTAS